MVIVVAVICLVIIGLINNPEGIGEFFGKIVNGFKGA